VVRPGSGWAPSDTNAERAEADVNHGVRFHDDKQLRRASAARSGSVNPATARCRALIGSRELRMIRTGNPV